MAHRACDPMADVATVWEVRICPRVTLSKWDRGTDGKGRLILKGALKDGEKWAKGIRAVL